MLVKQNVVNLTILGNKENIEAAAKRLNLSLDYDKIQIINPATSEKLEEYSKTLFELRKSKGISLEMSRDLMHDVSYFGTMMVFKGEADGMVSGAAHTTQHTYGVRRSAYNTTYHTASLAVCKNQARHQYRVFHILYVFAKSGFRIWRLFSSADTSRMFGIEPKVAMLSYSSGTSGEGEDVDKVRQATDIVKQKRPDLKVEGPIQYDAAVDPSVGKKKMPNSEVAGQASVLIFPDLNTGNNTYKAVQRETGALAIGPMLQGLNKPVNDLSRGCTVDDVFNTVVITSIQAQQQ